MRRQSRSEIAQFIPAMTGVILTYIAQFISGMSSVILTYIANAIASAMIVINSWKSWQSASNALESVGQ